MLGEVIQLNLGSVLLKVPRAPALIVDIRWRNRISGQTLHPESSPYTMAELLQHHDPDVLRLEPLHEVAAFPDDVRDCQHSEKGQH